MLHLSYYNIGIRDYRTFKSCNHDTKNQESNRISLCVFLKELAIYNIAMLLSRREKERMVIKLAEEDRTTREMAK
jgi:hypothetical protein